MKDIADKPDDLMRRSPQSFVAEAEGGVAGMATKRTSDTALALESGLVQDALGHAETRGNGHDGVGDGDDDGDSIQNEIQGNMITSNSSRRLRAIEVVLGPPSDPDSYHRIPPSRTALRVLGEMESGDETYYQVELKDGRVKYVSAK
ncbi:hypothetical protein NUW58_g5155 [Xylaria curta]|uniref:Uncharacterized protein n=1 Tax=Xylaria curta TaxID=42375 RepID=A0ACC1P5Z2_9PEZI|nr:hypothetical protein NUW58_g5155 [Xylaria curta]